MEGQLKKNPHLYREVISVIYFSILVLNFLIIWQNINSYSINRLPKKHGLLNLLPVYLLINLTEQVSHKHTLSLS